jgi:hypothetical protein
LLGKWLQPARFTLMRAKRAHGATVSQVSNPQILLQIRFW